MSAIDLSSIDEQRPSIEVRSSNTPPELLRRMREIPQTLDVIFALDGCVFSAHRAVCSAASPVLHKMLIGQHERWFPVNRHRVTIERVEPDTWKAFLDYLYNGTVSLTNIRRAIRLVRCARQFQVVQLETDVAHALLSIVDVSNCGWLLAVGDDFNMKPLKEKAMELVVANFLTVSETGSFYELTKPMLEEVLMNEHLQIRGEADVLRAIIRWMKYRSQSSNKPGQEFVMDPTIFTRSEIGQLTRHISLDRLNPIELRQVRKLAVEAGLQDLIESTVKAAFFKDPVNSAISTPIPVDSRMPHCRNTTMFSFSTRFTGISKLLRGVTKTALVSSWKVDSARKNSWRVGIRLSKSAQGNAIDLILRRKSDRDKVRTKDKVNFQVFIMTKDERRVARKAVVLKKPKLFRRKATVTEFIKLEELRTLVNEVCNSVVFGATIYSGCAEVGVTK